MAQCPVMQTGVAMQSGLGELMRERFLGAFEGRLVGDKTAGAARRGVAWRG